MAMLLFIAFLAACTEGGSIGVKEADDTADTGAETDTDTDTDTDTNIDSAVSDDADADGYLARVDCDDTDATVNPGADEVWYDGVDQDCDGSDDDQDGDSYLRADDCDDTDVTVHPGAGEVPQDGIDQDCDGTDATGGGGGDTDTADADGDGWASEAYGGPDCDDANAERNPSAEETRGDGVDSDCDGADFGIAAVTVGDLVITEIMYDPDAVTDGDGEWFEVYVAATTSVNLKGLLVSDDAAFGAADIFTVEDDLLAAPGDRLVFAANGSTTANGGITADYDYAGGGISLNNSGDDLYLGLPGTRVTTLDSVTYDETASWPLAKGASIELKDTTVTTSANDSRSNWCLATRAAGSNTDKGSPGAVSSGC